MANFYVTTGGNDTTGDGSIGTPWASLHKACSVVSGVGDVINVAAGSYTDNTQAVLGVGVKIAGTGLPVITSSANPYILASTAVPCVDGSNEVSGLSLIGSGSNVLFKSHGRTNQKFHDNILTNGNFLLEGETPRDINPYAGEGGTAISAGPDRRNSVEPATTDWATGCQIYNNTGTNSQWLVHTIKGGLIHHNLIDNSAGGSTKSCWGNTGYFWHSTEFYNNEFHTSRNASATIAIEVWNISGDTRIHDNRIDGWASLLVNAHGESSPWSIEVCDNNFSSNVSVVDIGAALEIGYELQNVLIQGNYFANLGGNNTYTRCIALWGQGAHTNYHIRRNIFHTTNGAAIEINSTLASAGGLANPANIDNIYIYNNIFDTGGVNGVLITNSNSPAAQDMDGIFVRNNYSNVSGNLVAFNPNPPTGSMSGNFCDHNQKAAAQTGYVQSPGDAVFTVASNVSANGGFRAIGGRWRNYYQPSEGSNLIGAGVDVGLPFTGAAPDIGAFEYDGAAFRASPVAF